MKHTLETLLELAKTDEGRQQIRVMVAELVNLPKTDECPECYGSGYCGSELDHEWCESCKGTGKTERHYVRLPNYAVSLDAMAEVADYIRNSDRLAYLKYGNFLQSIVAIENSKPENEAHHGRYLCDATALQRAIASILTKQ